MLDVGTSSDRGQHADHRGIRLNVPPTTDILHVQNGPGCPTERNLKSRDFRKFRNSAKLQDNSTDLPFDHKMGNRYQYEAEEFGYHLLFDVVPALQDRTLTTYITELCKSEQGGITVEL